MSRAHATIAVRAGVDSDSAHGAVMPPIVLSSNFSFEGFGGKRQYDYTRSGNPTRDQFAGALAELEGGSGAAVTATGMAAITLVTQLLSAGDLLVAPHDGYGGTWRLFSGLARRGLIRVRFVDYRDPVALAEALAERPRIVWIESPSNPLLRLTDLASLVRQARQAGAISVVDNTFLTPLLQRPFEFGADLVVHSTTKYLNGHSDVVGGAVVWRDAALGDELRWWANALGITGAPFDAWLALRGLRTLHLRLAQHEANAAALAHALIAHPAVRAVHWPGLVTHPDHLLAQRQQRGFGAMLSAELAGGTEAARAFCAALELFTLAESLGGVESLVAHPATMTHASMDAAARAKAGIGDGLLRFSPGIEAEVDLLEDLRRGLAAVEALHREVALA